MIVSLPFVVDELDLGALTVSVPFVVAELDLENDRVITVRGR